VSDALIFWAVGLTFGVPIAFVVAMYGAEAWHRRRLGRFGRSTTALVAELRCDPGAGDTAPTYWAHVQYDDDGVFVTTRIAICHAEYDRMRVGTPVRVDHLPGRPDSARRL
jgi:hypothetical protein